MLSLPIIITIFLVRVTWAYNEELYSLSENLDPYSYPSEFQEDSDFDVRRRNNNNFLRFGRSGGTNYDVEYDDFNEDFARPTRSGKTEKNDHFIRFGRSKQDFLRFGRDQHRVVRDRSGNYLRFGRSVPNTEEKVRNKRDTYSEFKRGGSNFMRFGRNSNFLRFGRNNEMTATSDPEKVQQLQESPLVQLLSELLEHIKKGQDKNRIV
jgi:hypothetical protein